MLPIFLRASSAAREIENSCDPTGSILRISCDSWSNLTICKEGEKEKFINWKFVWEPNYRRRFLYLLQATPQLIAVDGTILKFPRNFYHQRGVKLIANYSAQSTSSRFENIDDIQQITTIFFFSLQLS